MPSQGLFQSCDYDCSLLKNWLVIGLTQRGQDVKETAQPLDFIVKNDVLIPGTFQREYFLKHFINIPQ